MAACDPVHRDAVHRVAAVTIRPTPVHSLWTTAEECAHAGRPLLPATGYRFKLDGYEICFVPGAGEERDEVCDVDMWVIRDDGERWSGTVVTLDQVRRLMDRQRAAGDPEGPDDENEREREREDEDEGEDEADDDEEKLIRG
ncbi:hypothetical protein ACFU6R_18460 [Streptomyces sp. NPDC057499]|uniref:hypothetical protein n=1 Tax=Streptomyces sp. NPDC057499 TaxID=3346150 RepID=UPI0036BBFF75